jgi:hypothetical protein
MKALLGTLVNGLPKRASLTAVRKTVFNIPMQAIAASINTCFRLCVYAMQKKSPHRAGFFSI